MQDVLEMDFAEAAEILKDRRMSRTSNCNSRETGLSADAAGPQHAFPAGGWQLKLGRNCIKRARASARNCPDERQRTARRAHAQLKEPSIGLHPQDLRLLM